MADNTKTNKTRIFTDILKKYRLYKVNGFSNCFDLIIREISLFNYRDKMAIVVYIEDLVVKKTYRR